MIEKGMTITRHLVMALSIVFAIAWVVRQTDTNIASLSVRGSGLRGRLLETNMNGLSTKNELRIVVPAKQKRRHLSKLVGYGGEPAASHFPLQLCEGDCDNGQCDVGLICFQRSGGEEVPGCTGKTQNTIKTDYCIEDPNIANAATYPPTFAPTFAQTDVPTFAPTNAPTSAPTSAPTDVPIDTPDGERDLDSVATLTIVGQDGEPAASYPLNLCEGDCDDDLDCAGNLICYFRNENMPAPPGCEGTAGLTTRVDFCVLPPPPSHASTPTTLVPTGTPSTGAPVTLSPTVSNTLNAATSPTVLPLGGAAEIPYPTASPVGILGSTGNASMIPAPTVAPAPNLEPLPVLRRVGNNGQFQTFPLENCMGDCDTDLDCAPGLMCFQRTASQPVPGCLGVGLYSMDYCILQQLIQTLPTEPSSPTSTLDGQTKSPTLLSTGLPSAPSMAAPSSFTSSPTAILSQSPSKLSPAVMSPSPSQTSTSVGTVSSSEQPTETETMVGSSTQPTVEIAWATQSSSEQPTATETMVGSSTQPTVEIASATQSSSEQPTATETMVGSSTEPTVEIASATQSSSEQPTATETMVGSSTEPTIEIASATQAPTTRSSLQVTNEQPTTYPTPTVSIGSSAALPTPAPVKTQLPTTTAVDVERDEPPIPASEKNVDGKRAEDGETPAMTGKPSTSVLPRLQLLGVDGIFDVYPLGVCQGSCSDDKDCLAGLTCFHRNNKESVPGCDGEGQRNAAYCIESTLSVVESLILSTFDSGAPLTVAPSFPVTTADRDEETHMPNATEAPTNGTTAVFPNNGTTPFLPFNAFNGSTLLLTTNETMPSIPSNFTLPRLKIVGNGDIFDVYPLTLCEGDCDDDSDCAEGLQCYHRSAFEPVPGCDPSSSGVFAADYCVNASYLIDSFNTTLDMREDPDDELEAILEEESWQFHVNASDTEVPAPLKPTKLPTVAPTLFPTNAATTKKPTKLPTVAPTPFPTNAATTKKPTKLPTAAPTLSPTNAPTTKTPSFSPATKRPSPVPTERPTASPTASIPSAAPAVAPSSLSLSEDSVVILGAAGQESAETESPDAEALPVLSLVVDHVQPLGECMGDCNTHDDCGDGLFCYHRNQNEMPVPGCSGFAPPSADFCVRAHYYTTDFVWEIPGTGDYDAYDEAQAEDAAWQSVAPYEGSALPTPSSNFNETSSKVPLTTSDSIVLGASAAVETAAASSSPSSIEPTELPTSDMSLEETLQPTEDSTSAGSMLMDTLSPTSSLTPTHATTDPPTANTTTVLGAVSATTESPTGSWVSFAPSQETSSNNSAMAWTMSPTNVGSEEATVQLIDRLNETLAPTDDPTMTATTSESSLDALNATESASAQDTNTTEAPSADPSMTETILLENLTMPSPASPNASMPNSTEDDTIWPFLQMIGNDGIFDQYPLQECEGDCDSSLDCFGDNLVCMQRIANEPVPGCRGPGAFSVDYCVQAVYLVVDNGSVITDRGHDGNDK